jgi:hypothetical protein
MTNIEVSVTYIITILKIGDIFPSEYIEDIIDFLKSKAVELGLGKHQEFYCFENNSIQDLEILFEVKIKKS